MKPELLIYVIVAVIGVVVWYFMDSIPKIKGRKK